MKFKTMAAIFAALSVAAGAPVAVAQSAPLEAYASLPALESVSLSPDGSAIAYVRRSLDGDRVIVQQRSGELLVNIDVSDRVTRGVFWGSPDHVLISSSVTDQLYSAAPQQYNQIDIVNVRNRRVARALRTADKAIITANMGPVTPGTYRGKPVLYMRAITTENQAFTYDVYRVDLDDGRGRLHQTGAEDTGGYIVLKDGQVVARQTYDQQTGLWRLLAASGANWRELMNRRALLDQPALAGLGRTDGTVLVFEDQDDGPVALEISLADGTQTRLENVEDASTLVRDGEGRMVGIGLQGHTTSYQLFDDGLQASWDKLQLGLPGRQLSFEDADDDLSVITFRAEGSGEPGAVYLFDSEQQSVSLVGREYPDLKPTDVAQVSVVRYKAADGLDLFGYLTVPSGREARDLPLIMMPHGGPAARDRAGFDWWSQAMASRGYAVFQPQFRGSDGFGKALLEAGYGEWGRKMQSDLSDAVNHLSERGVINKDRVCIVGASYGGYAALAGMTIDQGVYRCAVAVAGVSDLPQMLTEELRAGGRARQNQGLRYWQRFMGAETFNDPALVGISPARLASRIQGPVMLIHGRADTVVPYSQSQIMERAMREAGKPVEMITLEGEDHYLSFAPTRLRMLQESLRFLETHNPPY